MNAKWYIEVLKGHLLDCFEIHEADIFMQDGAACHHAKKVTDFLWEKCVVWTSEMNINDFFKLCERLML